MTYTTQDLKQIGPKHFAVVETGGFYVNRLGRRVKETEGRDVIKTAGAGTLEESRWTELYVKALKEEGKGHLLETVIEYCKTHCAWLKEHQLTHYACDCIANESYKAWDDFECI